MLSEVDIMAVRKFEVIYISNGGNKTTQKTYVIAHDKDEAKRIIELRDNKVIAVVYIGMAN
jgi:hypothetical protein